LSIHAAKQTVNAKVLTANILWDFAVATSCTLKPFYSFGSTVFKIKT